MWVYNELTKKGGKESHFFISWLGNTCTITIQSSHFGNYETLVYFQRTLNVDRKVLINCSVEKFENYYRYIKST